MKSKLFVLALAVLVMTLIGSSVIMAEDDVTEIRFLDVTTPSNPDVYNAVVNMVEEFNEENPDIHVEREVLPSNELRNKISIEMQAGNPANIFWSVLSYTREFMKDDLLVDIREAYKSDPEYWNETFTEAVRHAAVDNKERVMMSPWNAQIGGLFYNKEIFDRFDLKAPETLDELINVSKELQKKGVIPMVTGGKDQRYAWLASAMMGRIAGVENTNALTIGDKMTEWDNPEYGFPQMLEKFKEMIDAGVFPSYINAVGQEEASQMFSNGEAAMIYEGQWLPGHFISFGGKDFVDKVGMVPFPVVEDAPMGDDNVRVGGVIIGLAVADTGSEAEKEASLKFLKKITSPGYGLPVMNSGGDIYAGNIEYDESQAYRLYNDMVDQYRNTEQFLPSMDTLAPPEIDRAIKETAMSGIASGSLTVEEAIEAVQEAAENYDKKN
ncbi:MAG: ABC transporter substrate-binding protein [Halothermotrichaceae bacterium]